MVVQLRTHEGQAQSRGWRGWKPGTGHTEDFLHCLQDALYNRLRMDENTGGPERPSHQRTGLRPAFYFSPAEQMPTLWECLPSFGVWPKKTPWMYKLDSVSLKVVWLLIPQPDNLISETPYCQIVPFHLLCLSQFQPLCWFGALFWSWLCKCDLWLLPHKPGKSIIRGQEGQSRPREPLESSVSLWTPQQWDEIILHFSEPGEIKELTDHSVPWFDKGFQESRRILAE